MVYNIDFELVGLIICLILLIVIHLNYDIKLRTIRFFRLFILFLMGTLILDIVSSIIISNPGSVPIVLNYVLNIAYFGFATTTIFSGLNYIIESCNHQMHLGIKIVIYGIVCAYGLLLILNPFTDWLFYFDNIGNYYHGAIYLLNYIVPFALISYMLYVLIVERKKFSIRKTISNYSFIACTVICGLLQMLVFPNVLLTSFGGSISAIFMLFSLETPDFVELEYLKNNLQHEVVKKTEQIENMSLQTIAALAQTIDAKDEYTRGHSARVAKYSRLIASTIGYSEEESFELYKAALLHDIGKIGIPDSILKKRDKLTDEEYETIKTHTIIGSDILSSINIPKARYIARHHHERFDGLGYPDGLKGIELELDARIVAIADAYDAMSSDRIYRLRLPREQIIEELNKNKGFQFDEVIVNKFLELLENGEVEKLI